MASYIAVPSSDRNLKLSLKNLGLGRFFYVKYYGIPDLQHVAPILLDGFATWQKALDLVNRGDVAELGRNLGVRSGIPLEEETKDPDTCKFLHRDMGELSSQVRPKPANWLDIQAEAEREAIEYVYLFTDRWWLYVVGAWDSWEAIDVEQFHQIASRQVREYPIPAETLYQFFHRQDFDISKQKSIVYELGQRGMVVASGGIFIQFLPD